MNYTYYSRYYTYIYSIRTLSENMKFIWMIFRNRFCSEFKLIWSSPTMYVYCGYPAMSEIPKQLTNCLKRTHKFRSNHFRWCSLWSLCLYCYHFLLSLYMNEVPVKTLLGPWLNNTEDFLTPFICTG